MNGYVALIFVSIVVTPCVTLLAAIWLIDRSMKD